MQKTRARKLISAFSLSKVGGGEKEEDSFPAFALLNVQSARQYPLWVPERFKSKAALWANVPSCPQHAKKNQVGQN